MEKIITFFKNGSTLKLLLLSCAIGLTSKLVEPKFSNAAMGLQLIAFTLLIYSLIKFFNKKVK